MSRNKILILYYELIITYHKKSNNITAPINGIILVQRTLDLVPALPGATFAKVPVGLYGIGVEKAEYPNNELLC